MGVCFIAFDGEHGLLGYLVSVGNERAGEEL
jgi:hypothetical protein